MAGFRVSHIVAPGIVGGLESVVVALASGMARRGHQVRVLALLGPEGHCEPFEPLGGFGVEVVEIRVPSRSYRTEVQRLSSELSSRSGAIAHSHGYHADLVGYRSARRSGCPIVSTAHGFAGGGLKNRLYEWLDRRALSRFDAVVAVSRPLASRLSDGGAGRRLHVIPNAYAPPADVPSRADARRILDIPPEALVAGWVGRLSPEKGPDLFLDALALVPGWSGSIIGTGDQLPALREHAQRIGLEQRIRWHGMVPEAGKLLTAFDALVLSSRTEGTPIILLEGMAAGTPLVVTAVGGVPDVVTDREAIVVAPEDPGALARALQQVHAEPGAAERRAVAARARVETDYAVDPWLDQYETVYRGLISMAASKSTRS